MTNHHTRYPTKVHITVNDHALFLEAGPARLLSQFRNDEYRGDPYPGHVNTLVRRGWVIRTRGHYRLTPAGQDVHAAVVAYYARKQADLTRVDT